VVFSVHPLFPQYDAVFLPFSSVSHFSVSDVDHLTAICLSFAWTSSLRDYG